MSAWLQCASAYSFKPSPDIQWHTWEIRSNTFDPTLYKPQQSVAHWRSKTCHRTGWRHQPRAPNLQVYANNTALTIMAHQHKPCRRTGRRHQPWAPNSQEDIAKVKPHNHKSDNNEGLYDNVDSGPYDNKRVYEEKWSILPFGPSNKQQCNKIAMVARASVENTTLNNGTSVAH